MSSIIRATTTSGLQVAPDNSGSLQLQTNGTTAALTIDTSQNVGIGTTSPAQKLEVSQNVNSDGAIQITNANAGTSAISEFRASNGTNVAWYGIGGTSYTGYAQIRANGAAIYCNTSAGIGLSADNAAGYITFGTGSSALERMRIDSSGNLLFNSGYGSVATAYGCRAWVNFNGTGTVAIRASGNVSSITDNGGGDYTINFTNAMPDANFAVAYSGNGPTLGDYNNNIETPYTSAPTSSSIRVFNKDNAQAGAVGRDLLYGYVAIFR